MGIHTTIMKLALSLALLGVLIACGDSGDGDSGDGETTMESNGTSGVELPEAFTAAVLMPTPPDGGGILGLEWAVHKINAAGGILGEVPFELRYIDTIDMSAEEIIAEAEALAVDDEVFAVIGPNDSELMMEIAPLMIEAQKPLVSFQATSGEVLRAFGGAGFVWRTKMTDIVQVAMLLRQARIGRAERIGLLTNLQPGGETFFNWFGFTATSEGYAAEDVMIEVYGDESPCEDAMSNLVAAELDEIVIVLDDRRRLECVVNAVDRARRPNGDLPFSVVIADTGLDLNVEWMNFEERALGIEGWSTGADVRSGFNEGWEAFYGNNLIPAGGPSSHDAVLLLAYGLEASGGAVGKELDDAIAALSSYDGAATGIDEPGIKAALEALRAGETPDVSGATGSLSFDADLGIDLTSGTDLHWRIAPSQGGMGMWTLDFDATITIGEDGDLPPPRLNGQPNQEEFTAPEDSDGFTPDAPEPQAIKALVLAASSGWDNYRHQADALAMYQRLRAGGLSDDDIVMIGADDIADNPENKLPGQVRNVPDGPDVYQGVVYDYDLRITPEEVASVLLGEESVETPEVLELDAQTNLFIYIVGHGGATGVLIGGETTEEGVTSSSGAILSPKTLREALCALRAEGRVRRVFTAIEACYSGTFGDASFDGVESACEGAETSAEGVLLMTASNPLENSLGTGYDFSLGQWVGDEFSVALGAVLDSDPDTALLDVYKDVYLGVSGSHVNVYNSTSYGRLQTLTSGEYFIAP